jgi:protein-disulfide isomerase
MDSQDVYFSTPPRPELPREKRWYQRWWGRLIIGFLAVFVALSVAVGFYVGKVAILLRSGKITTGQLFGQPVSQSSLINTSELIAAGDPHFGPANAKVVIIEFADFQCPACQQAYPVVKQILKDYGDKVLFIFRDFPAVADHPEALLAAMAGECANEQGKFFEMHDKIFSQPDKLDEATFKTYAVQIGLNSIAFNNCMLLCISQTGGKCQKDIETDLTDGLAANVNATPTFFIDGVKLPGAIPLETFQQIIISELSR